MGDSTTHVHEASTGAAYYDTVARLGNGQYAVWAAGMVGYGNFQEYLMLLKIYEEVRPESIACLDIRYELGLFHTIKGWLSPTEENGRGLSGKVWTCWTGWSARPGAAIQRFDSSGWQ
ncbi:MAG TPA: hypothetical protein VFR79_05675 [Nitrospira sp.]|nr:hypothetical protein [Nitrospira sp.]